MHTNHTRIHFKSRYNEQNIFNIDEKNTAA